MAQRSYAFAGLQPGIRILRTGIQTVQLVQSEYGNKPLHTGREKTVSYEIWEQMEFHCPDFVIVSVGDGNIISGIYKGFFDLYETGLIDKIRGLLVFNLQAAPP